MGIQVIGLSGDIVEAGPRSYNTGSPLHSQQKPLSYGSLGHYRTNHRCLLVNTQAANSKLFEVRNTHATNLIVPTRLVLKWMQTGTHTAAIEDSLDVYRVSTFTAVDTTNVVTPGVTAKRASMAAGPGAAAIRGVTAAGAAAGMTGGTMTKDATSVGQLPKWLLAAMPTAGPVEPSVLDVFDDVNGTHPFVFAQNEGLIVENRVLLGAAAASVVYIDFSWAEVATY
jgi:hypothetical protein